MKKYISVPNLINISGLLAALAIAWFALPYITIAGEAPLSSPAVRLIIMALIIFVWAISIFIPQLTKEKAQKGQATARELKKQQAKEKREFKKRVNYTFHALKNMFSENEKTRRYIYKLPWYLLIGLPGSGKTSALVNSGLKLSLRQHLSRELQTKVENLDQYEWWLTEDAVILDAAKYKGEMKSEPDTDAQKWNSPLRNAACIGMLKLLKTLRRKRPINGVIVTVSVSDLFTQGNSHDAYVNFIRQRIQTLYEELDICVPVYLLFTKCDRISGFNEFFNNLSQDQRSQPWGITFPFRYGSDTQSAMHYFQTAYDEFVGNLEKEALVRLNEVTDSNKRQQIISFPKQLQLYKSVIVQAIQGTFGASQYYPKESVQLRGIYFCSAQQYETTYDLLGATLAQKLQLPIQHEKPQIQSGKSYFLKNLFTDLIFKEATWVGHSHKARKNRDRLQIFLYLTALGTATASGYAIAAAYNKAKQQVSKSEEYLQTYHLEKQKLSEKNTSKDLAELLPSLLPLQKIHDLYDSRWQWFSNLTLREPAKIQQANHDIIKKELNEQFIPNTLSRLESKLNANQDNPDELYDLLKAYLVFSDSRNPEIDTLNRVMQQDWQILHESDPLKQQQLQDFLTLALAEKPHDLKLDKSLIQQTQEKLNQLVPINRAYRLLEETSSLRHQPGLLFDVQLSKTFRQNFSYQAPYDKIPAIYTKQGFKTTYQQDVPLAADKIAQDNWEIGITEEKPSRAFTREMQAKLRTRYTADYVDYWQTTINKIQIKKFRDLNHAIETLSALTSAEQPIAQFLNLVSDNTRYLITEDTDTNIQAHFNELNTLSADKKSERLNAINQQLQILNDYLTSLSRSPNTNLAQLHALHDYLNGGNQSPIASLNTIAENSPQPIKRWLNEITDNSLAILLDNARKAINAAWETEIIQDYRTHLQGRFPINTQANTDVNLNRFSQFFGPNGSMERFFNDYLKPFVDQKQTPWRWQKIGSQTIAIPAKVLQQFEHANQIKNLYFNQATTAPEVAFSFKPLLLDANARAVNLKLGKQDLLYRHGPQQTLNLNWPISEGLEHIRIAITDFNANQFSKEFNGPWALFKLLESGKLQTIPNTGNHQFDIELNGKIASYTIGSTESLRLFTLAPIKNFDLPNQV